MLILLRGGMHHEVYLWYNWVYTTLYGRKLSLQYRYTIAVCIGSFDYVSEFTGIYLVS